VPEPDRPATLTVEQAGHLLGISRRSAYRAAEAGHIPVIRLGRRILVPTALLERMLGITTDTGEATADPDPRPAAVVPAGRGADAGARPSREG
jgi:excisionase family DNA binding protein